MTNESRKERVEKWQKLIDEYLTSNMTQKSFCNEHNLNLPQFVYYLKQFKREKEPHNSEATFVPVKIHNLDKASLHDIKITLPNGFQCVFPNQIDTVQVKRLIEVLLSC